MSNKLITTNKQLTSPLNKSLRAGSLGDLVRMRNDEAVVLVLDCSGSMDYPIRGGESPKRRIDGLREAVDGIQKQRQVKMIAFGPTYEPQIVTAPPNPGGGTPLHTAIDFTRSQQAGRCVVISDGEPDSPRAALDSAIRFGGRIDVVFVGDPGSAGEAFLKELAAASGGTSFTGDLSDPKELTGKIMGLLGDGSDDDDDDN